MKRIVLIILSLATTIFSCIHAQSVSLEFPHFAGQEWYMTAFCGEGIDTITAGRLDSQGKTHITLSAKYKNYRGMTQWLLRSGGGLDIIVAGNEDITVSCLEAEPSEESIKYINTYENNYLNDRHHLQQAILEKINAMRIAEKTYEKDNEMLPIFKKELKKQEILYNRQQEETASSQFYASRFAQIVNITRGLPPVLSSDDEVNKTAIKDFIVKNMDFTVLYTSGHWTNVLDQWLGWYINIPENEMAFTTDFSTLKNRITDTFVQTAFVQSIRKILEREKRNDLALLTTQQQAPVLVQGKLPRGKKIILAFYDSGCSSCNIQLDELSKRYPELVKKNYEVLSFAADIDKLIFEQGSKSFPWTGKYCDLKSFEGPDFVNYRIMGTPTFFLINEKGIIQGLSARIKDLKL